VCDTSHSALSGVHPRRVCTLDSLKQRSEPLCANNITILKLLSEEVFDFGKNDMTSAKVDHLKKTLNSEFAQIFQLCDYILRMSSNKELLTATLQTLLRFMSWIPLGYIFKTKLVELLVMKFFASPVFRCDALQCISEIAALDTGGNAEYDVVIQQMYVGTMNILVRHIPPGANVQAGYRAAREEEKLLIQRLSLFFTNFFKVSSSLVGPLGRKPSTTPVVFGYRII